ncbi:ribonuclease H-like domain-containing protein [Tanacetum coccineum]
MVSWHLGPPPEVVPRELDSLGVALDRVLVLLGIKLTTLSAAKGRVYTAKLNLVTADEKTQKKNDVKARSMLLMAPPNEHLLTFNQYKDAKTLFAAIQTRFGGNDATKKTQKTLLKQMCGNFSAPRTENKPDLDKISFDDLYNNFKIVEQEVKGTTNSSSSSSSQNMAFVSTPSSTNEVNTTYGVSTANTQVSTASAQVSTTNLSDAIVYAFLANQPNGSQLVHEDLEQIHEDDLEEMDLKWQLALLSMRTRRGPRNQDSRNWNQDSSRRTINVEETSSKAMLAIDGAGLFSPPTLDLSNSGLEEFQQPEFEGYGPKTSKSVNEFISNEVRETPDALLVEELVSNDKLEKKIASPTKIEFVRPKQQEKPVKYAEMYRSQGPRGNQRNWNNQKSQQLGSNFVMYNKACFVCGSFDHVQANCNYHQRERVISSNNYTRVNYNYSAKKAYPSAHRNIAPRAVLIKTGLRPLNTTRHVNTAHHKTIVHSARPMSRFSKSAQSTGHPQKVQEDQGYVDSGCSRHMTGNMSHLSDFKEFNEGHVTFGREANGGKITSKGTLKTNKLDLDDLLDESQILLRVPRNNNMYNVDMKNIVPKESLTCLIAKATLDESVLWHTRLATKDETTCILKKFITEIENLADKKVKIIRCDNGTEFKNSVMDDFCAMKVESKLPTIFWAEGVNTACYVQNRVLVVKPHIKTPYELSRGRTHALSFMRPFGCHVTILNTLDYLGKFDGKSDEGFFVGYSLHSKAFRVYNTRTRKVEENLHVRFLEDKPIITGNGPERMFDIDMLTKSMNYVPVVACTNSNDFAGTKDSISVGQSSMKTGSTKTIFSCHYGKMVHNYLILLQRSLMMLDHHLLVTLERSMLGF